MATSRLVTAAAAALALLAAVLAAPAWWAVAPPQGPIAAAADAPRPRPAGPATQGPRTAAAPALPQAQPAAPPAGLTALLTAPEARLRASLLAALAVPAHGGRLHARALARRCADLAALQPPPEPADPNDARHQRAVARGQALATGCGQLGRDEWLRWVNVAADEPTARDPLLAVQQSDLADAPLLQAVFRQPDPLLLDELGARLLERRLDGEPRLYFDGQRFDDEADRATVHAALRLLPCHFGLACDERDPEVWLACLRGDGCAASRAEQAPPAAAALAARLAAAVRAQELGRFMPP